MDTRHGSGHDLGVIGETAYQLFRRLPEWVGFAIPFAVFLVIELVGLVILNIRDVAPILAVSVIAFAAALIVFELALITYFVRSGRWKLFQLAADKPSFISMNARDFERFVGELYEHAGYRVDFAALGADGGYDLVLHHLGERALVQCKQRRWTGVADVRELFGVLTAEKASRGVLVASGVFSDEAKRFAAGKVELVDGTRLVEMIEIVRDRELGHKLAGPRPPASISSASSSPGQGGDV